MSLHHLGGSVRSRLPEQTRAWLWPLLERCGVTRVARITGLDDIGIPVSVAVRPLSRTLSVSQGKGLTETLADISAAMESVELWHAETLPPSALRATTRELLGGRALLDVTQLKPGRFPHTTNLHALETGWHEGLSLADGRAVLVPELCCVLRDDEPRPAARAYLHTSNGLASGNTLAEASAHALLEVIERDASARHAARSVDERAAREVALDSLDGAAAELCERVRVAGHWLRLWEETSAVGVPAFGCELGGGAELRELTRFAGYGAHFDRGVAACRAITEAAQSRLTMIAGSRDDMQPWSYDAARLDVSRGLALADQRPTGGRPFAACAESIDVPSFERGLDELVARLAAAGLEQVVRVDLTRADVGVPVAFVFVPGALEALS
ncbi:MAG: YcaO-like family protein [Myxococcales bacterium]|nr:YcaO-like family protein [Myxococcales bacterium]